MKQWIFQVDADNGNVIITHRIGPDFHLCILMDPETFGEFAGMVNGALGDSKMAAS